MPGLEWNWLDDTYYSYCLLQPQEGGTIFVTPVTLMRNRWGVAVGSTPSFFPEPLPAGRLNFSMHNGALCWPSGQISNSVLKWCCWEFKAPQPALSKPPPNWNQQTPTGLHQCYIMSRKSEVFKDCPPRHHKQYTCWLQTVVLLSLQGPAPPGSPKEKKLNPPVLSQLLGTQNLVYTNPGQRQNRKTRDNII